MITLTTTERLNLMSTELFVGIDIGTSGVRAIAIDKENRIRGQAVQPLTAAQRDGAAISQNPGDWWQAVCVVLDQLKTVVAHDDIRALALDGTSGTLLLTDADGQPLTPGLMYNDARSVEQAQLIKQIAPAGCAAHGASSALAKLLYLQQDFPQARYALHQADWVAGRLSGHYGISDENNVLKLGYDVVARRWPDWFDELAVKRELLPQVHVPGEPMAKIDPAVADKLGLPDDISIVAGTTDGVAAFLATGAAEIGDAVTSLGSTLVIKVLSAKPLFAPQYGIYSHRLGERWLPGGASNSGGAALLKFFDQAQMQALSEKLDPANPTGLQYYPLPAPGERFPINDPELQPVVEPRPDDDGVFFQGLLEGIAAVERRAYRQLETLGAPYPRSVRTVGGGATNTAWTEIRKRALGVAMLSPSSAEAAYGSALLARKGSAYD